MESNKIPVGTKILFALIGFVLVFWLSFNIRQEYLGKVQQERYIEANLTQTKAAHNLLINKK